MLFRKPETGSSPSVPAVKFVDRLHQQLPIQRGRGPVGSLDRQEIARHQPDVELPPLAVLGFEHRRNHGDLVQHDGEAGNVVGAFHGWSLADHGTVWTGTAAKRFQASAAQPPHLVAPDLIRGPLAFPDRQDAGSRVRPGTTQLKSRNTEKRHTKSTKKARSDEEKNRRLRWRLSNLPKPLTEYSTTACTVVVFDCVNP